MITASCHCGKITIDIAIKPVSVTECNCSICRRYAAKWAYYARKQVAINGSAETMTAYSWGDRCIEYYHCNNCGCITHYEGVDKHPDSRVAVNARMLPPEAAANIPVRKFDGADTWKFIDE